MKKIYYKEADSTQEKNIEVSEDKFEETIAVFKLMGNEVTRTE